MTTIEYLESLKSGLNRTLHKRLDEINSYPFDSEHKRMYLMIRVNELFSGIGAFRKALENFRIPHEIVGISEIDKYAIRSYEAIYGKTRNYGDISKIDKLDYADLWTYGFPCQDISVAGRGAGIVKGETRSGLLYEVERLLLESQKSDELPKYLIMENVKNLVSKKFIADFEKWLEFLESLGYTNHWQVLNAKDYGIPQNRERVFCISILGDKEFVFPEKQPLRLRLKDLLEDEVDEKFYLSQEQADKIKFSTFIIEKLRIQEKNYCGTLCCTEYKRLKCVQIGQYDTRTRKNSNRYRVYDDEGISPTIHTSQGGNLQPCIRIKNGTKKGFLEAVDGDGIDLAFPTSKQRRGRVQKQIANTLDTSSNKGVAIYSPTVCIGSTQKNAAVTDGSYAPTLTSSMGTGGGHVPMIDTEPLGTLYVHNSKAFGNGYMNDLSKTIKAGNHDTFVVLKTVNSTTTPRVVGGIGEKTSNNGKQYFYQNRIYDSEVATAVATSLQPNYLDSAFRVRKLTPKECWRLMGFDDKSFEKAERVCSNTQLYKQAGNSIVVNVLERVLENLLQDRPWETEEITRSEWLDELLGGDE